MTSDSNSDLSISYSSDLLKSNGMNRLFFFKNFNIYLNKPEVNILCVICSFNFSLGEKIFYENYLSIRHWSQVSAYCSKKHILYQIIIHTLHRALV